MKRFLLLALMSLSVYAAASQDVIVTKQSERIDGKVEEISETEIKYRLKRNPNGPLFTIKASNVVSVMFENGEIFVPKIEEEERSQEETYNVQSGTTKDDEESQDKSLMGVISSKDVVEGVNDTKTNQIVDEDIPPFVEGQYLIRNGRDWMYGDKKIGRHDLSDFLAAYCPDARKKMKRCRVWGTLTSVFSSFAIMGSAVFVGITAADVADGYGNVGTLISAVTLLSSTCVLFVYGVNLKVTAGKRSVSVFNEQCRKREQSVTFNAAPAGIGLTYNF